MRFRLKAERTIDYIFKDEKEREKRGEGVVTATTFGVITGKTETKYAWKVSSQSPSSVS
jgi:hypothetical protein